jgi:subtilisin-like proprotein convertase family protein
MRKLALRFALLMATLALVACGTDATTEETKAESNGKDGNKADQWNPANNPSAFQVDFEYNYDELKQYAEGRAEQTPWPSDYWSYYEDSTNVRYMGEGTLSPVEKYDVAFNNWTANMELKPMDVSMDCETVTEGEESYKTIVDKHTEYYDHLGPAARWQHKEKGNYKARDGIDNDNDGETDECGGDDYDGIETWWGLCHAWVPAAILEPEPGRTVTVNGVEFTVSDIKALMITMYDRSSAHMLGSRCNDQEVERDDQGRALNSACRDTNPGSFHVVITNMLGKMKRAFAEDRTMGYQVWNQPIMGYQILKEEEFTEEQVMEKLDHADKKFHDVFDSPEAVAWRYVKMDVDYLSESSANEDGPLVGNINSYTKTDHYEYILELDKDNNIVGGEWINYSVDTHPDFLWLPIRAYGGNPHMTYANVKSLLDASLQPEQPELPDENIKTFGGPTEVAIPDNDANGITYSTSIDESITIGGLKVTVDIEHTYIGDLKVVLVHDGVEVMLHERTGGGNDNIHEAYPVNEFNGADGQGEWTLKISDHAGADVGKLTNFQLHVSDTQGVAPETKSWTSDEEMDIPDNDTAGISTSITVSDSGVIRSLKVSVFIEHTYCGDLIVKLKNGTQEQTLHNREGGSADDLVKEFPLNSFNGASITGDWTLFVSDNAGIDLGQLVSWEMEAELE